MNDISSRLACRSNVASRCRVALAILIGMGILPRTTTAEPAVAEPTIVTNVVYARPQKNDLLADVYVPGGEGPFPTVLMVHGGAWMSGSKWHVATHAKRLMQRGYTVVAINYRLAPRFKFPAQLDDCRAALRWIRAHSDKFRVDSDRIAGFGYSAGAQLVCLLGLNPSANPSERLQAVVAGGTPSEFRRVPLESKALSYWLGGTRQEIPDAYRNASPASFVSKEDPPVFLFHGSIDRVVQASSSRDLFRMLQERGVPSEMHIVADSGHLRTFFDNEAAERAAAFLDANLQSTKEARQVSP